jgi:hypothetical protein
MRVMVPRQEGGGKMRVTQRVLAAPFFCKHILQKLYYNNNKVKVSVALI